MKVLLVDNGTKHLDFLEKLAADGGANAVQKVRVHDLKPGAENSADLVILSGSSYFPVIDNEDYYAEELELIKRGLKPILGICLGCELIAHAFGCKLAQMLEAENQNWIRLEPLRPDPINEILRSAKVYESHKWAIVELGPEIEALATSKDGYEIIKHRAKPIYGLQFHPELDPDRAGRLLNLIARAASTAAKTRQKA